MTYVRIGLHRSGKLLQTIFCLCRYSFSPFRLFFPLRRCPFLMRGLLWKSRTPGRPLLLPPSLQKGGIGVGGVSLDALVLIPEGLPLLLLDFCPVRGVEEPLVARSVHASLLLCPRFIRGLGVQELLFCAGIMLPTLSWLALPPHLCTPCEVMGWEGLRRLAVLGCLSLLISLLPAR